MEMVLYRPIKDVKYLGAIEDTWNTKKYDEVCCSGNYCDNDFVKKWSDAKDHDFLDISPYERLGKQKSIKSWKRNRRMFEYFNFQIYPTKHDNEYYKIIPVEIVKRIDDTHNFDFNNLFFKHKLYTKQIPVVFCINKKSIIAATNKYINSFNTTSTNFVREVMDSWKDGMIFKIEF